MVEGVGVQMGASASEIAWEVVGGDILADETDLEMEQKTAAVVHNYEAQPVVLAEWQDDAELGVLVVAHEVETADVVQEVPDFAVATAQMIVAGKMNCENGVVV